jgi:hypothetical protein
MTSSILTAVLCLSTTATASEIEEIKEVEFKPEVFFAVSVGAKWIAMQHPAITTQFFSPALAMQAGINLSPNITLGVEANSFTRRIERKEGTNIFELAISRAGCNNCMGGASGSSAPIQATDFHVTSVGFRFDYALLGETGPYAALLAGLSGIGGIPPDVTLPSDLGVLVGARVGYRYRYNHTLELVAEGGWQGQFFGGAQVHGVSLTAGVRAYFR